MSNEFDATIQSNRPPHKMPLPARRLARTQADDARTVPTPVPATPPPPTVLPPAKDGTFARRTTVRETVAGNGGPPGQAGERRIGRYRIERELARGGMGAVLIAEDEQVRRQVAMKVMLKSEPTPAERARFVTEAQVTGQLDHPAIPPIHEVCADEARPYFTMKLVRGKSLKTLLTETKKQVAAGTPDGELPLPLRQRLEIFIRICEAIAFAHSRHIVHRDLKPDNVMVGRFGEVQVMDWGLAKRLKAPVDDPLDMEDLEALAQESDVVVGDAFDDANLRTREGAIAGTPAFMAPEQARGEVSAIDERTDVYSLGLVLHAMLSFGTAYRTPKRGTMLDLVKLVRAARVEKPSDVARRHRLAVEIPPELESIVARATALAPRRRYQSADDLAADVRAYLADRPVSAHQDGWRARLVKAVRRRPAHAIGAAAAALLLVLAGGLLAAWSLDAASHEAARARIAAEADAATARAAAAALETDAAQARAATAALEADAAQAAARQATLERLAQEGRLDELQRELGVAQVRFERDAATHEFWGMVKMAEVLGVWSRRALEKLSREESDRYIQAYERVLAADQEHGGGIASAIDYVMLGMLFHQTRSDWDQAQRFYEAAQKRADELPLGWYFNLLHNLAAIYHVKDRVEQALPLIDEALSIHETGNAHALRAMILWRLDRMEEGNTTAEAAIRLGFDEPEFLALYGLGLTAVRRWDEAWEVLQDVTQRFPDLSDGWLKLAMYHANRREVSAARAALDRALSLPTNPQQQANIQELQAWLARQR